MNEFYINCMTGEITATVSEEYPVQLVCSFKVPGSILLLQALIQSYIDLPASPMSVKFTITTE